MSTLAATTKKPQYAATAANPALNPRELRALGYGSFIYDGDNFKLKKLDGGWMYANLLDDEGKTTQNLLPDPSKYPPYTRFPKEIQK